MSAFLSPVRVCRADLILLCSLTFFFVVAVQVILETKNLISLIVLPRTT